MASNIPTAITTITHEEPLEHAKAALAKMLRDHGHDYKFPSDVIWLNTPPDVLVPSLSRPHIPKKLLSTGHLELTGAMTKAQSEKRAGSSTKEYRFGPALVQRTQAAPAALAASNPNASTGSFDASAALSRIQELMDSEGYVVSSAELANFFLAMTVSPLVILSGISGTGKSLLPRKFAQRTQSDFLQIPVQPQWADNTDLFGYVPTLAQGRFIEGKLIKGLRAAKSDSDKLVIAVLDEMNLAPVEHYFSDFLSVAETRARDAKGAISSDELPIELPAVPDNGPDEQVDLRGIRLPANLRIVGTANMDETTHTFSPKVLDRAFTIEFDDPDLTSFASGSAANPNEAFAELAKIVIRETNAISVLEARAASQDLFEHIAALLAEIQDILAPAGIKFGYRTRDAILMYLHFWRELKLSGIVSGYAALDFCILQKVLPKISGSGEGLAEALKNLAAWLKARSEIQNAAPGMEADFAGPLERSHQKVERMATLLDLDGTTRFWGA